MNNYLIKLLSIMFIGVEFFTRAEATNDLYVTESDDPLNIGFYFYNGGYHREWPIATTNETLSAKDFPEGNWGATEHGLQLSLRFEKSNFTNGESISATLLLRNTTASNMDTFIYPRYTEFCDGPANFNITSASEVISPSHAPVVPGVMPRPRQIPDPKSQHKLLEHVDSGYKLTNGTYTVQAVIKVIYPGNGNGYEHCEVKSAKVPVTVK